MPQDSAIYGVSRIRSAERGFIGRERMRRLAETDAGEALRQLVELGYGSMPDATLDDVEAMISNELAGAADLVREVSIDAVETDIFLMSADMHNLKLLIKLRLTGGNSEPQLMRGGCFDPKLLSHFVEEGEYGEPLPEELADAFNALEVELIGEPDPAKVSTAIDSAYISYALGHGSAFTKEYFRAFADFTNVAALLRVRAMKGDADRLKALLVTSGDISRETLIKAFDMPDEGLVRALCSGNTRDDMKRALEEAAKVGAAALERARDDHLMRLAANGTKETDTIAPVIGYLLAKRQEAKDVRLIMTVRRNGLPDEAMNERMRVLYGE